MTYDHSPSKRSARVASRLTLSRTRRHAANAIVTPRLLGAASWKNERLGILVWDNDLLRIMSLIPCAA
jgi:hypothetical protein